MRALVQRVKRAKVEVDGAVTGQVGPGLLVYLGVGRHDTPELAAKMAQKVANLRIFEDAAGKMNLSVRDVRGGVLVISNFTLLGDARRGRRPEFTAAADPELAQRLYEWFVSELRKTPLPVECGIFRASMTIDSAADGPVNVIVDLLPAAPPGDGAQKESSEMA
jgi:D-aminoacyl-tRNA deacylase